MERNASLEKASGMFPSWLRRSVRDDDPFTGRLIRESGINTVCRSARCPNIHDCFSRKKCTFLLLGERCSRACTFCSVKKGHGFLGEPSADEIDSVLKAVTALAMNMVTLTSVTRDDLPDGGSGFFADCVRALKGMNPGLTVEVLAPDFQGDRRCVQKVLKAGPNVFSHNVETSPRLYEKVRPQADYRRSLYVLKTARTLASSGMSVKSGFMVGLGESHDEVREIMRDLRYAGCDSLAVGQYLKPDKSCIEVNRYVEPEEFRMFSGWAGELGFQKYSCSPFTRSSYLE